MMFETVISACTRVHADFQNLRKILLKIYAGGSYTPGVRDFSTILFLLTQMDMKNFFSEFLKTPFEIATGVDPSTFSSLK